MDDNKARMMSTRWMSCDDPENGSLTQQGMVWGTATDLSGLTNYTQVPVIARYDDESAGGVTALTDPQAVYATNSYGFLPSDYSNWIGEINSEDDGTRWCSSGTYWNNSGQTDVSANNFYIPSPYAKEGAPNPLYRATEYSGGSINNALSYFDGKHQTDVILAARGEKDYETWKPTAETPEDYPAASCCDMYHTIGTNQGDWYLPSQAELGYVVARLRRISNAMAKVNGLVNLGSYGNSVWVWSSSEYESSRARNTNLINGYVSVWAIKVALLHSVVAFSVV